MPMTSECNAYADVLTEKRILYMPSCVIVEMMTKLYSRIFAINLSGDLHNVMPELLGLMHCMRTNLRVTAEAYGAGRINFFTGDWRDEDKLRARRVFFNIMSHLGYIAGMVRYDDREALQEAIKDMTADWVALDRVMDAKAAKRNGGGKAFCKYFRNRNPDNWKQKMANIILTLDEDANYAEADHLVLLCFERIKKLLVSNIETIERREGRARKFNPDRIAVVSQEECTFSCPTCLEMTDSVGTQVLDEEYPDASAAENILSMKGAFCPMRPRPKHFKKGELSEDAKQPRTKPKKHTTMQWLKAALWGDAAAAK